MSPPAPLPGPGSAWRATLFSAVALALALTGDQLLYVVLPLQAEAFGLSIFWVGILLSANRWIRVLAYGEVARLGQRIGPKRMTVVAAICATISTTLYAAGQGEWILLGSRLLWGLSFAAFNLTALVYALGDGRNPASRLGLARAVRQIGPALAAAGGAWLALLLGPRDVFYVMSALTALSVPLALALPDDDAPEQTVPARAFTAPTAFDLLSFGNGFTSEGVFMVTVGLLFATDASAAGALLSAGIAIAGRHVVVIVMGPIGGVLADRFGIDRVQLYSTMLVVAGFAAVPLGFIAPGVTLILLGRGTQAAVGPIIATRRNPTNPMRALSANATWGDLGAALGPTLAGIIIGLVSLEWIYAAMALMIGGLYGNFLWRSSRAGHQR